MKERLVELKNKATERANYYSNLDFCILANEFTEFANFLNEIENVIEDNEKLRARVQTLEEEARERMEIARAAHETEEYFD